MLLRVYDELNLDNYKQFSIDYHSYLFSDSHGTPLRNLLEVGGVYNFSAVSDSYIDIQRKLNFVIKHGQVDTVYLAVDDHMLSPYRDVWNNEEQSGFYSTYENSDGVYSFFKEKYLSNYVIFFRPQARSLIRSYLVKQVKLFFSKDKDVTNSRAHQLWSELKEEDRVDRSRVRFQAQFQYMNRSTRLSNAFIEILDTCRENQIVVLGVKFPLAAEYIQTIGLKTYGADSLLSAYGNKVLDFKHVFKDNSGMFHDHDHLNKTGSKEFVKLLLQDNGFE